MGVALPKAPLRLPWAMYELPLRGAMFGYIWVSLVRVFSLTDFIRFEPIFSRKRELLFLTKHIQTETETETAPKGQKPIAQGSALGTIAAIEGSP